MYYGQKLVSIDDYHNMRLLLFVILMAATHGALNSA